MLETMHLESINVGRRAALGDGEASMLSGIDKSPVAGPVRIDETGLSGDVVVDTEHHGGADQAIYAYSADDYDWWASTFDHDYFSGLFGENLTIRGLPTDMNIGDRLLIGEVVLEATAPRIPCKTLSIRMRDPGFGLKFRQAERPGVYFRVLNGGEVAPGDAVTFVANPSGDVSVLELFRFAYALHHDPAVLRRFLLAPVAERFRTKIESRLAAADENSD